jgi:hypothetical protein
MVGRSFRCTRRAHERSDRIWSPSAFTRTPLLASRFSKSLRDMLLRWAMASMRLSISDCGTLMPRALASWVLRWSSIKVRMTVGRSRCRVSGVSCSLAESMAIRRRI